MRKGSEQKEDQGETMTLKKRNIRIRPHTKKTHPLANHGYVTDSKIHYALKVDV